MVCLFAGSICAYVSLSPHVDMRSHVREGIGVHDIQFGPKFYKFKLLGKLAI